MNNKIFGLLFLVIISTWSQVVGAAEKHAAEQPPHELIEALKSGGYIIYMRHGITKRKDKNRTKTAVDLTRCETQRNLTEEGRLQVARIGKVIKALKIPIGQVKSSPYCRTQDTARAVFGDYEVDDLLAYSMAKLEKESAKLGQYLYDSILSVTDTKNNTVFVGHTANLKDGLDIWPKPEGVAVIFKIEQGNVIFKGMIKPDDWPPVK
ncbi:histidine phosphatase family protein [Colwellia psychrerythraea]|uniref:Phosphoglycerate mutase n=1 Tax=Colwellia psychrerythraea TaxID=28229 RepID=A0A099K872_COLPS|nr:histidine phosphatase family protein [Colwellia psychrerythraea]KGJ86490.1 Phosphoglycerate mutase [Colwellia psychrerythraea]